MSDFLDQVAADLRTQLKKLDNERRIVQALLDVIEPPKAPKELPPKVVKVKPVKPKKRYPRPPVSPDDVLALVHDGVTKPSDIGWRLNAHYMTVTHTLRALEKDGQVKRAEKGVWVEVEAHNWTDARASELAQ